MLASNGKSASTDDRASLDEARAAIASYTRIVEQRLKPSLDAATSLRNKAYDEIAELKQMSNALHIVKLTRKTNEAKHPEGIVDESGKTAPALETRVNIGEEFYVRANIYDLEKVIVDLGLGVMVEMTVDEAQTFVKDRLSSLEDQAKKHSARISEIQAHLESITECLSELEISTRSVESLYGHATFDE